MSKYQSTIIKLNHHLMAYRAEMELPNVVLREAILSNTQSYYALQKFIAKDMQTIYRKCEDYKRLKHSMMPMQIKLDHMLWELACAGEREEVHYA